MEPAEHEKPPANPRPLPALFRRRGPSRPGDNPLARLIWRGQLRRSQAGMLLAGTFFISAVTLLGKINLRTRAELPLYLFLRWGLAEFFWIWMAADHLFSTVLRWKHSRAFEEWHLTGLTAEDFRSGFLRPTILFLLLGTTVHCGLDALIPYGYSIGLRSSARLFSTTLDDVVVWRVALSLGMWLTSAATILVACTWSFREAMDTSPKRVHGVWFATLCRSGIALGILDVLGLLGGGGMVAIAILAARYFDLPLEKSGATITGTVLGLGAIFSAVAKVITIAQREWSALGDSLNRTGYLHE